MTRAVRSVDVVVSVHQLERPVARTARSAVVGAGDVDVRVLVVCHGISADEVAGTVSTALSRPAGPTPAERALEPAELDRVRFVEHVDGIRSPAGPFNAGLDVADATWVSIIGSDDWFAPGAIPAWLRRGELTAAAAVLARVETSAGRLVRTPPSRLRRRHRLDPVRDRLAYRSAPLGLLRRDVVVRLGLRFTEGLASGEDLAFSNRLWTSGERLELARDLPPYVVGEDSPTRVSLTARPVAEDLRSLSSVTRAPWFASLSAQKRLAICVELLRVQVFGAVWNRRAVDWARADRDALAEVAHELLRAAPDLRRPLSLADARLLDAMLDPGSGDERLLAAGRARRRHGYPDTLLTRDPRGLLHVQGPLRTMAASALW